ncbi:hypothetical protein D9M71_733950 [compost metagenome]
MWLYYRGHPSPQPSPQWGEGADPECGNHFGNYKLAPSPLWGGPAFREGWGEGGSESKKKPPAEAEGFVLLQPEFIPG